MRENRIMSVMLRKDTSSATVSDTVALASMLESPMLTGNCSKKGQGSVGRSRVCLRPVGEHPEPQKLHFGSVGPKTGAAPGAGAAGPTHGLWPLRDTATASD